MPRRWKSPLRSLGVSKGSFSTVENGPFVIKKETPYSVSFRLHFLRVLREVAKSGERDGVVDRHLAEHLAVDLDALDLPLPASARLMLHALRKGVRAVSYCRFRFGLLLAAAAALRWGFGRNF